MSLNKDDVGHNISWYYVESIQRHLLFERKKSSDFVFFLDPINVIFFLAWSHNRHHCCFCFMTNFINIVVAFHDQSHLGHQHCLTPSAFVYTCWLGLLDGISFNFSIFSSMDLDLVCSFLFWSRDFFSKKIFLSGFERSTLTPLQKIARSSVLFNFEE